MAESPRSSFIPKQAPKLESRNVGKRKRHFNLFGFIGSVILIGTLLLAGGTFFYEDRVNKQLVEVKNALAEERRQFDEGQIALVREMDRRINAAAYRLDKHVATSKIFDALELNTNRRVQFQGLSLLREENSVLVELSGVTEIFPSVALQELAFGADDTLDGARVESVTTDVAVVSEEEEQRQVEEEVIDDPRDNVGFEIAVDIPHSAILYTSALSGASVVTFESNDLEEDDFGFDEEDGEDGGFLSDESLEDTE